MVYRPEGVKMNRLMQVIGAIGMLLAAQGQGPARPDVPESLKAPVGEEVILAAHATGTQIYVCQQGTDQKNAWVFKAPEAELTDAMGKKIIIVTTIIFEDIPYPNQITNKGAIANVGSAWLVINNGKNHERAQRK